MSAEIRARRETGMGAPLEGTARLEKDEKEPGFQAHNRAAGRRWPQEAKSLEGPEVKAEQ